ncbi:FecCD family ABC transporter permease [Solibacillus sp. FSL H8-0538]|uniref:FecCD family ABC transporter permease n=1 Tax=Solibacillus sp. FSL H8-0538 TaxID=2921400 RepID=UPI0030F7AB6D
MMGLIAFLVFICGISIGASSVSIDRILPTLFGNGTFKEEFILFTVRLPRVLLLSLAGMCLALAGSILQTLTKNDLADPGIIGINAGAGVGITIFYLLMDGGLTHFAYILPAVGFLSAIVTAAVIYFFAYDKEHGIQPVNLVLIGVGFASALSGLMMLLISSADRADVQFVAQWLAGSIWGADWPFIWALLPWLVIALPIIGRKTKTLNILALNEATAKGLGVYLKKERAILLTIAVALAAAAVSVTGSLSFIGLIAPHIAKKLVGASHQRFIWLSMLIGATFLVLADTIGRVVYSEATIPTGIVVAVIGAPYFIYLLKKAD